MTLQLLIGTQNKGKLTEYRQIFEGLDIDLLTLGDVGLGQMDVEETGTTFAENAEIKAAAYAQASGMLALADDSGLCVDALDGRPGLYSARYGGEDMPMTEKRLKLLGELEGVPEVERTAYFACDIAVYHPERGSAYHAYGECRGRIAEAVSTGGGGFGYDPIFIPEGYTVTIADISTEEKHELSHRGRAARAMRPVLERLTKGLDAN
ncbi:MAG: RdgB/HAM1 family non-canonical purine NTP pyrophosphatase [Chloroflexota bacterium]